MKLQDRIDYEYQRRRQAALQSDHEVPVTSVTTVTSGDDVTAVLTGPWGRDFVHVSFDRDTGAPIIRDIPAERAIAGAWRL